MKRSVATAFVAGFGLIISSHAEAQIGRRQSYGGATWWMSASGGYTWGDRVTDPKTQSDWRFDRNWSASVSIEREFGPGVAMGVTYNYSRLPLRYQSLDATGTCDPCRGDATMASYGLTMRSGEGARGLHFASQLFIGAVQYSHFTLEGSSASALAARSISNTDFAYGIGLGFGYSLGRDWEWTTMLNTLSGRHEQDRDIFGQSNSRHYSLQTGVRVGVF